MALYEGSTSFTFNKTNIAMKKNFLFHYHFFHKIFATLMQRPYLEYVEFTLSSHRLKYFFAYRLKLYSNTFTRL